MSVPDYPLGETLDFKFTTRTTTGAPTQLAGTPAIVVYEDNSTTEITAGITLSVDFDSRTGLNNVRIVATGANGFESGKSYQAVISAGTVGGTSVVGEVVQQFTIERTPAVMSSTFGNKLNVSASGDADVDVQLVNGEDSTPLSYSIQAVAHGRVKSTPTPTAGTFTIETIGGTDLVAGSLKGRTITFTDDASTADNVKASRVILTHNTLTDEIQVGFSGDNPGDNDFPGVPTASDPFIIA